MKHSCPVCSSHTVFVGIQKGKLDQRDFEIRMCYSCGYSYVENFRTDFTAIYDEDYYRGLGADPMVDYVYELKHFAKTIRNYEWEGVLKVYKRLCPQGGRWLDFGCGGGGLVKYALERGADVIGAEDGWAADEGRIVGIPIIHMDELEKITEPFDFISAIEVIEHVPQPIDVLLKIRKLLKPGGIIFLTTGNAKPWRSNLLRWPYTQCPDVHVSFFEPQTLFYCLREAGFNPKNIGSFDGFVEIIKFKVLKTLRIRNRSWLLDLLPWSLISRMVDARHKVSKHPYGVAI